MDEKELTGVDYLISENKRMRLLLFEKEKEINTLQQSINQYISGIQVNLKERHKLETRLSEKEKEIEELKKERNLAIAHDTQPYPTAWAYEQLCKSSHEKETRIKELENGIKEVLDGTLPFITEKMLKELIKKERR